MTYPTRHKRKIYAPKRYEDNTEEKKDKKDKKDKKKNKHCTICDILIDSCYMDFFEIKNKIYCDVCYNDLNTVEDITEDNNTEDKNTEDKNTEDTIQTTPLPNDKPKLRFIIMNKDNPNLIDIINNKILQEQDLEQDLENPARKHSENTREHEGLKPSDEEDSYDEEEDSYDEEEEDSYDENDYYLDNPSKKEVDPREHEGLKPSENDFNNLFIKSILNRINNINNMDNMDKGCCAPINNKQKNKGNKYKDYEYNYDNDKDDNSDTSLEYVWLGKDIKDIDDLIRIGKTYNPKKRKRHNLNLKKLNKLVDPLIELKNMIGMKEVKKIIFDQIIYYLQNLDDKNVDMLHTVIVGPPGVGKTQLTYIIAKIYNKLGFLKTDKVICAKRDDLIGEYIGQTAPKTRKVLESALGGVLLLDEVYALSPNSEKDFAREAIDMINVYLSEHCHDFVCVIAGYKKPTYENFLAHNEGLARRFTHHFEIKGYNAEELTLIFKKYLEEQKWGLLSTVEEMKPIIEKNLKIFPNFGGDMTTLFACCKKTHSKRLLLIPTEEELNSTRKKIHIDDIEKGIKLFIEIKSKSGDDIDDKDKFVHMYS